MKKNILRLFVIVLLTMISIPFIFVLLKIKVKPINPDEKNISLNFKRNFPLRSDLFKIYGHTKKEVFDVNPIPHAVIEVADGWKFLGNKFSNALSESKGLLIFNKEELNIIKKNILDKKKWLDEKNIKFYLSIAPNKHSIYGDLIPIKKMDRKTKLEQVDSLCKEIGVVLINLGSQFPEKTDYRLYHKTDSHWNHLGGFYAYQASMDIIRKDFPQITFDLRAKDDIEVITYPSTVGDLNRALFLKLDEEFIDFHVKRPYSFQVMEHTLTPPSDYHFGKQFYEERYTSNINNLKILVLRDSFFGAYYQLMADSFGESLFVWRHNFNPDLIASESPQIVYYEIVERNIDILLTPDFQHSPD